LSAPFEFRARCNKLAGWLGMVGEFTDHRRHSPLGHGPSAT
jgi:hypothetical protein